MTVVISIKIEKLSFFKDKMGKCREINKIEKLSFKKKNWETVVKSIKIEKLPFV